MSKPINRRYSWYKHLCVKCAYKECRGCCDKDEERGFIADCQNLNKRTRNCYCVEQIQEPKPGQKCVKFKEKR